MDRFRCLALVRAGGIADAVDQVFERPFAAWPVKADRADARQ
ncbi:hypothetical protein [Roseomonas sp. CECT 9278]|nr:hypothetical protein [Roseomonas sp. CECT 9278]